ncbi:transcription factor EC isoform X1 [Diorhabda carinulata]|uniref:transcription factor EC isoform X1 n=2 Tax=Diorhabda carinulata TaxID=1163345 RepID=UPI0025A1433C|nr:transcription factor EC isoform X1 [Diorhabda carinulata]
MAESGIDIGYDLSALLSEDFDIESAIDFDDLLGTPKNQEFYELTSKTMPIMESTPNLKTTNPVSRTQLKLQLMRDHAILQQQRQNQQKSQRQPPHPQHQPIQSNHVVSSPINNNSNIQNHNIPENHIKVPLNSIAEVPPQVLQVQTKLANPTKYHVMQKQKNQVKQYLSESFQVPSAALSNHRLNQTHSAPTCGANTNGYSNINNISNSQGYYPQGQVSPNYDVPAMSPALSSGATSCTSEAEDLLDDLLSLESSSLASDGFKTDNSFTGSDLNIKNEPYPLSDAELHALAKDRQKKDNHNMIERRRRFNINDRIKELGTLLPKNNDPYYEIVRDVRPNKGTILKSSVEYIKCLKNEVYRLKQQEARQKQMESMNRRLQLRVQELERQAKSHGLPVSDFNWQNMPVTSPPPYNSYSNQQNQSSVVSLLPPIVLPDPCRKVSQHYFAEELESTDFFESQKLEELKMPDVISDALSEASLNLSAMEEGMDDDDLVYGVNGDPMLSSPHALQADALLASPAHPSSGDPLLCEQRLPTPTPTSHIDQDVDTLDMDMIA